MYDPRYSPAYQIPFQPLYETTRLEIERSIFTLEEKFRRVIPSIFSAKKSILNFQPPLWSPSLNWNTNKIIMIDSVLLNKTKD